MKAVVQRVTQASVTVNDTVTGKIEHGLLVLVAVHKEDELEEIKWVADKIVKLRVFEDDAGKMNKSLQDINGGILLVSQFTLYGDVRKGTRPSFINSAQPQKAEHLYDQMISYLKNTYSIDVQTGRFAAKMDVALVNDGPVTLIVEKNKI
ncbi:MAG: D-aminoacyl-tRNA deacylase [Balneolales bacterium]